MLIAMLDGLRQGDGLWDDQRRTPPVARSHRLSIGPHQDAPIAMPAIAEPGEGTPVGPLDRSGHCLLDQVFAQWAGGAGNHEATVPVLDQASPAFPLVRLASSTVFFCTNDQNSSISTWFRCRSLANTCVRAWATSAAGVFRLYMGVPSVSPK